MGWDGRRMLHCWSCRCPMKKTKLLEIFRGYCKVYFRHRQLRLEIQFVHHWIHDKFNDEIRVASVKELSPIQPYSKHLLLEVFVFLIVRNIHPRVKGELFNHFKQFEPHIQGAVLQISVSNINGDVAECFIEFKVEVVDENEAMLKMMTSSETLFYNWSWSDLRWTGYWLGEVKRRASYCFQVFWI